MTVTYIQRKERTKIFQFCWKMLKIPFYFLLPISRESIAFGSNFRNGDFDGFTRFEVS